MRWLAALFLWLALPYCAQAKPSRLVDSFAGDRYVRVAQGANAGEVARATKRRHPMKHKRPRKRMEPGWVTPRIIGRRNIFQGFAEELRNAGPSQSLAGVVAPLAAKAREIQAACGSRIISSIRHTYIAGTGGRLSLHASGRAVDIAGNPSCIYPLVRHWPGGVSVDYARVRHVHLSYAPNGPEWGVRFRHYSGRHRHRRYHKGTRA